MHEAVRSLCRRAALLLPLLTASAAAAWGRTVVSFTFDDGWADQVIAQRVLDEHGFKGTFYIITSAVGQRSYLGRSQVQALQADGHEVGGHTVDHLDMTATTGAARVHELCDNRTELASWGLNVVSFAYPFGRVNAGAEEAVRGCGFTNARRVGGLSCSGCRASETIPPRDAFDIWTPDSIKTDARVQDMKKYVENAQRDGGWVPLVFHHICDNCDLYATSASSFTAFVDWLKQESDAGRVEVRTVAQVLGEAEPTDPVPELSALSPESVSVGAEAFTLTVDGSGFARDAAVLWNGSARPTTYIRATRLRAAILASDVASEGAAEVGVLNPGPGGGRSATLRFRVGDVAPPPPPERIVARPDFSLARARPNPWRADRHSGRPMVFDQLPPDSVIRIFTVSAHWVRTLDAPDGRASWDLRNDAGAPVASGFYIYLATDGRNEKKRGVLAVIR